MISRIDFFKQFIGQAILLTDDARGHDNIPLNRLNELPHNIIDEIIPVFFHETIWELKDRIIFVSNTKNESCKQIELTEIEYDALLCFKKGMNLKQSAIELNERFEMSFDLVYKSVTSLFFVLANFRICHPKEVYKIDEIVSMNEKMKK